MEFSYETSKLIQLCIAFGLLILPLLVIITGLLCILRNKTSCRCSYFSICATFIKPNYARIQTIKYIQQPMTHPELN